MEKREGRINELTDQDTRPLRQAYCCVQPRSRLQGFVCSSAADNPLWQHKANQRAKFCPEDNNPEI